jgi:hypothetical protein
VCPAAPRAPRPRAASAPSSAACSRASARRTAKNSRSRDERGSRCARRTATSVPLRRPSQHGLWRDASARDARASTRAPAAKVNPRTSPQELSPPSFVCSTRIFGAFSDPQTRDQHPKRLVRCGSSNARSSERSCAATRDVCGRCVRARGVLGNLSRKIDGPIHCRWVEGGLVNTLGLPRLSRFNSIGSRSNRPRGREAYPSMTEWWRLKRRSPFGRLAEWVRDVGRKPRGVGGLALHVAGRPRTRLPRGRSHWTHSGCSLEPSPVRCAPGRRNPGVWMGSRASAVVEPACVSPSAHDLR